MVHTTDDDDLWFKKRKLEGSKLTLEVSQRVVEKFQRLIGYLSPNDWQELDAKLIDFSEKMEYKYRVSEWKCPINMKGCKSNCGDYGCGN